MRIGELARASDTTVDTVRFYEAEGLLKPADRSESGYRRFDQDDLEQLRFIRKAKHLGFSLDEIRGLLHEHDQGEAVCDHVLDLLDGKLQRIDAMLRELKEFRSELAELRSWADTEGEALPSIGRICAIIEQAADTGSGADRVAGLLRETGKRAR